MLFLVLKFANRCAGYVNSKYLNAQNLISAQICVLNFRLTNNIHKWNILEL